MLFFRALFMLIAYDALNTFSTFGTIHKMVTGWTVARRQVLCLQCAFVTAYLLRRKGVPAHMVLGAQKLPFKAHAWVEVDGRAINERSNVQATYAVWDRC